MKEAIVLDGSHDRAFDCAGIPQVQAQVKAQAPTDSGRLQQLGRFKEGIEGFVILEAQQNRITAGDGAIDDQTLEHLDDQQSAGIVGAGLFFELNQFGQGANG